MEEHKGNNEMISVVSSSHSPPAALPIAKSFIGIMAEVCLGDLKDDTVNFYRELFPCIRGSRGASVQTLNFLSELHNQ